MDREGFRNRMKQYKKAREENPGLKYWEWKAQPAEKDIPKYDEGGEVYDAGMLPEIVVTPEEWQKDFSKNFADARIRKNIYRGIPVYSKLTELTHARKRYNELKKSGQLTKELIAHFENKLDSIYNDYLTFSEDPDYVYRNTNDEIKRLYDIWNVADRPKITSKNSIFGKMFNVNNAHWNPINNSIYNSGNIASIVAELAHPIQYKTGDKNKLTDYIFGAPKAIYGSFTKYSPYKDKDHYEYDTHSNVEPALREYIAHGKNTKYLNSFAEGTDGVMGPPTYEQWDTDTNRYTPTILDNASLYWSMEAAKKDLHNAAMKLPGYAERWAEYYRSLPKTDPDINEFVDELWENENPNNVGLKNGKYYPHKSPEGGAATIGPGFKLGSGSHKITKKQAERGMTKYRLDQEARRIGKQHLNAVDRFINYGQTTNPADTVSPQIKMGLMDLRHLVGPLNEWSSLREAVLNGDIEGIRKESTVTWNDNGKTKVDKRRKKIRDEKYFHYDEGGEVELDPLEVLERSRPKINGIPINDKPLSGTDPLGELYLNLVSGNAVRKAVMNGINGIVRKSFYNSYKDFLKAGWNRHKAYDYASPGIGINVLPGITKGFDYTIRGANYMHTAEKFIE